MFTDSAERDFTDGTMIPANDGRTAIDLLDAQLIEILRFRRETSAKIQRQRMAEGGPRVVLSREMEIIARYTATLGPAGSAIAADILALCRGQRQTQEMTVGLDG